jgi:ATP-dependent Clp protease ATP-binding subunit ClpA
MTAMFERLDDHARHVVDVARHEADAMDHNHLGTEHLLVGLAHSGGIVAQLLAERRCAPDVVRGEILTIIGRGCPPGRRPDALLATLGIDLGQVRQRVEATFGTDAITRVALRARPRRQRWPGHRWWPGCDGGRPRGSPLLDTRWMGVAPRVEKVLDIAVRKSAPEQASPAQLMLAILEEGQGVACQILAGRGVDFTELATAVRAAAHGS